MTLSTVLQKAGITANTFKYYPSIVTLNLETNIPLDYHRDYINFDVVNGLIKIKYYNAKGASGALVGANVDLLDPTVLTSTGYIAKQNIRFPYRDPKIGDVVFFVKKEDNTIANKTYIIKDVYRKYIKLDASMTMNLSDYYMCYTSLEDFNDNENVYLDQHYKALLIKRTAVSNNDFDAAFDISELVGFDFESSQHPMV